MTETDRDNVYEKFKNITSKVGKFEIFSNEIFKHKNEYELKLKISSMIKELIEKCDEIFLIAAADFAQILTKVLESNNEENNYLNFCSFFEFAISVFRTKECNDDPPLPENTDHNEKKSKKLAQYFNLKSKDNCISEKALNLLLDDYLKYASEVEKSGLALRNWPINSKPEDESTFEQIIESAKTKELRFSSIPHAVSQWRKHDSESKAEDYFREAISNVNVSNKTKFKNLFKKTITNSVNKEFYMVTYVRSGDLSYFIPSKMEDLNFD
jgi:hypothetical protein